jgi:HSP20 family protein
MSNSVMNTRVSLDPFNELNRIRRLRFGPFNSSFNQSREGLPSVGSRSLSTSRTGGAAWAPPVDIVAEDSNYKIAVEIPGTRREDVSVEFHERVLTIKGSKDREETEGKGDLFHLERQFGSFERKFRLPEDSKQDDIKAVYRDGVLTIEIPKIEARKPTNVAIEA